MNYDQIKKYICALKKDIEECKLNKEYKVNIHDKNYRCTESLYISNGNVIYDYRSPYLHNMEEYGHASISINKFIRMETETVARMILNASCRTRIIDKRTGKVVA